MGGHCVVVRQGKGVSVSVPQTSGLRLSSRWANGASPFSLLTR
ncbi:MAG: hypothetical protein AAGM40_29305 [Cyanobacteria bacterium J06573_2]